jgi:hypothetical protein
MAYMSQERKAQIAPAVKAVLKKYKVKGSLSVRNHSTLSLTIKSGAIDFVENFIQTDANLNYGKKMSQDQIDWIRKNQSVDDKSDIQTDYFNVGWYVNVNIGRWNQPYVLFK